MVKFKCTVCGEDVSETNGFQGTMCRPCAFAARPTENFSYQRYNIGFTAGQEKLTSNKPSEAALAIINRMPARFVSRHGFGGVTAYAYATESVDGKPYLSPGRNPMFEELKEAK